MPAEPIPAAVAPAGDPADPALLGKTLSAWRADLAGGKTPGARLTALRVVLLYGPAGAPAVADVARHSPAGGTTLGGDQTAFVRAVGPAAVPGLLAGLKDPNRFVRSRAGVLFEALGPAGAAAVPDLTAMVTGPQKPYPSANPGLTDPNPRDVPAAAAARALGAIGPAAAPAVPALTDALRGRPGLRPRWP